MRFDFEVPTRGWNARDNMDAMESGYALSMNNVVPENGYLRMRGGTTIYQDESVANAAIGATGPVETLEVYNANGQEKLVAARNEYVYSIDDPSTVTQLGNGFTNARWQTMMFNGFLVMVNGEDAPQQFDGTTLSAITMTLKDDQGNVLGDISAQDLIGCVGYKGRAFYWADGEQRFFYADQAGGYAGDLIQFPIEMIANRGGKIVSIMNYSRDSGSGLDDYLVIHMSTGEAIVYEGQDPSTTYDWQIVNRYVIGAPVSIRGNTQFGGDQVIITSDGIINLTTALPNQKFSKAGNVGDAIVNAVKRNVNVNKDEYGWEAQFIPDLGWLIFNIPQGNQIDQFVLNTVTNAWFKISKINALTWTVWGGNPYYGDTNGNIMRAENSTYDERGALKNQITFKFITAFSKMGMPGTAKTVTGASVTHNWPNGEYLDTDVLTDYDRRTSYPLSATPESLPAVWDVDAWDEAAWSEASDPIDGYTRRDNFTGGDHGTSIALKVRGQSKVYQVVIYDLGLEYKKGGKI